eukprot:3480903-Ditylum_brightwellii.AAC.1
MEQECMKEVARRSRMSEQSPSMQSPLVEELQHHGMTSYGDGILQGIDEPITEPNKYTQL